MRKLLTLLFCLWAFLTNAQSVTISSSAPSNIICSGTSVTFTANATGFTNPNYQWYSNGTAISGATSSTYTSTSLNNSDLINVRVNEGPFGGAVTSNGLLLNLDATNTSSYSGSGTTWNNLVTGNEVTNFTIQSGGTYSTDNGGVIRFGNTGGGASSSTGFSNLSAYTVEVWVKPAGTMGGYDPSVEANYTPSFFAEKSSASRVNMVLAYNARGLTSGTANNSYRYEAAINYGGWKKYQIPTDYSSDLNNWVQIISSYNGSTLTIYRNGVALGTSPALAIPSLRTPSTGYWIAHRWDMIDAVYGDYSKVMMYDRALSAAEVSANYSAFNARFVGSGVSSSTINTTVYASPSIPTITMEGDACINKTTLSTASVSPIYVWAKDDVFISGASSNTYVPTTAGNYKVLVSNGTCASSSAVTTISTCGVTADGKMMSLAFPAPLVSTDGGANVGTGIDEQGKIHNTTGITTTKGTIGATTAIIGGVIGSTNGRSTSIGVVYSTDSNFGTSSTVTIQSNVAAGTYSTTLTGLTSVTTYFAKSFVVNKAGTSYGPVVSFTTSAPPAAVGDLFGGGIIYYILQPSDDGYDANVQHGLIAQPQNEEAYGAITWTRVALNNNTISGAQYDGISKGSSNSAAIIANQGSGTYLFKYVSTLTINGYTDWYVPSIRELSLFRAFIFNPTYCTSGSGRYYWVSKANSNYKWTWGNYISSTQTGSLYKTNYVEGNSEGTTTYAKTQSGDNFVYVAIRSF